jgi:hypothetical protein
MDREVIFAIVKCLTAIPFVIAGTYILINGNHYILCPCCYLAAYGIATSEDGSIFKIKMR